MSDFPAKLVSKLGSTESIIPLGVKDSFNSYGFTSCAFNAGGNIEGVDKFVDEFGTEIIWLFGIPVYKKATDKTVYKLAEISPEIDVRIVQDRNYLNSSIKYAPTDEIKKELTNASKNISKTKNLAAAKFLISMFLTMLSYLGLTKLKQNMTKSNIEKEFNKRMNLDFETKPVRSKQDKKKIYSVRKNTTFKDFEQFTSIKNNNPSFGSKIKKKQVEEFMLNPVKNMMGLDAVITGERLYHARTEGEFKEYAIKEGSFLFFIYFANQIIQNVLEKASQKFFKIPVSLDAKFLSSDLSSQILKDKNMQNDVNEFSEKYKDKNSLNKIYKFFFKNQDSIIAKAAKESGIIETIKDKNGNIKIDTRKYIDPEKIYKLVNDLKVYINSGKNAKEIKSFVAKVRGLKIASTIISIGVSCISLGHFLPKMIYAYRNKLQDGKSDFHVRTEYEKELASRAA